MASIGASASLSAATTGNGTTIDFDTAKQNVSAVVTTSGTISSGSVAVEASHDGTNWVRLDVSHLALYPTNHALDFSSGAYRYWRAVVVVDVAGGGSVTATFMEAG